MIGPLGFSKRLGAVLIGVAVLAPVAITQEPSDERLIEDRERGRMHPGDPLDLVGSGEGGNDFRARTPALQRTDGEPTYVDREALREQRLGLYAGGSGGSPAVSEVFPSVDDPPSIPIQTDPQPQVAPPKEPARAPWVLMAVGGLVVLGALGAALRSKS